MTVELKIDRNLRCGCGALACDDKFAGEYDKDGYLCVACVRALNVMAMKQARRDHEKAAA
jgi:hypothetical protein